MIYLHVRKKKKISYLADSLQTIRGYKIISLGTVRKQRVSQKKTKNKKNPP